MVNVKQVVTAEISSLWFMINGIVMFDSNIDEKCMISNLIEIIRILYDIFLTRYTSF